MKCEICSLDSATDSLMWKCTGCPRVFHAACVGVTVQRNSLRSTVKSKKVDFSAYLLPCCESCQELVQAKLEFNRIVEQQKQLTEQIHFNTEVTHRFSLQHEKPNIVHEAVEGLEVLLQGIKFELSAINKNSSLAGSVIAIKNHVTSLFDTAMLASKECMSASLKPVTSSLSNDLRNISEELNHLQQLSREIASSCTMTSNPVLELDILDELKSLSANIASVRCTAPVPPTPDYPSLEIELNRKINDSGWRHLGTRKVWRSDWTEYDARQLRRKEQQKIADKARKRRNQQRRAKKNLGCNNNSNYNNVNYRSTSHTNPHNNNNNNSLQSNRNNNKGSPNNNNNFNINFSNTIGNRYNNNDINRSNMLGNHNHTSNHSYNNYNNNHNNLVSNQNTNDILPPDRELLAAAKHRFSRPPTNYRPTIQFQRGEILNPYPASDVFPRSDPAHSPNWMAPGSSSAAACAACSCRHSCFPRH